MRRFVMLCEELEARPDDADRVAALARWLGRAGREAGLRACGWLLGPEDPKSLKSLKSPKSPKSRQRAPGPPRLNPARLLAAARVLALGAGTPGWLFDAGASACADAAEAVAFGLPWPGEDADPARAAPTLPDWWDAWCEEVAAGEDAAAAGARAVAALADGPSRRWAVRALCGAVRPLVDRWQWTRAWGQAFGEDPAALAWRWHVRGREAALAGGEDGGERPRPEAFASHAPAGPVPAAGLEGEIDAGRWWLEPHWKGERVQVVRRAGAIAVWHAGGELLNHRLDERWLQGPDWPGDCVIEAVLVGWQGTRVVPPWRARGRPSAGAPGAAMSLHLALLDWHAWDGRPGAGLTVAQRRDRLRDRWPEAGGAEEAQPPPPVFTTPRLDSRALARRPAHAGWGGWLLRRPDATAPAAWALAAPEHRVAALLQYVPAQALAVGAARLLATAACGFAIWNRPPDSAAEQAQAFQAFLEGRAVVPAGTGPEGGPLRLVPLARLPLTLPEDELERLRAGLRDQTGPRFGTLQAVEPTRVFEIAYEGVSPSRRHRAGVTLEAARVVAWRAQAQPGAAGTLADLARP